VSEIWQVGNLLLEVEETRRRVFAVPANRACPWPLQRLSASAVSALPTSEAPHQAAFALL